MAKLLGIDYGSKRIGLALSDERQELAFPYVVFPHNKEAFTKIVEVCEKEDVEAIVIGESRDYAQKENPIMKKVYVFVDLIKKKTSLPLYFEPEYLTTAEAKQLGKPGMMDAQAAAIILQSWIDKKKIKKHQ